MKKLEQAVKIAKFNPEKIDFALLVGSLANLKEWAEKEVHIHALNQKSMCDIWRKKGQKLINDLSPDHCLALPDDSVQAPLE